MTELVKELAKQAGITTNLDTDYFVNDPDSSLKTLSNAGKWVDYFSEKFAKLIVAECISTIENAENGYQDYRNQIEDGMRNHCIDLLKHKFGIDHEKT